MCVNIRPVSRIDRPLLFAVFDSRRGVVNVIGSIIGETAHMKIIVIGLASCLFTHRKRRTTERKGKEERN
jgi:hypothetical protein